MIIYKSLLWDFNGLVIGVLETADSVSKLEKTINKHNFILDGSIYDDCYITVESMDSEESDVLFTGNNYPIGIRTIGNKFTTNPFFVRSFINAMF